MVDTPGDYDITPVLDTEDVLKGLRDIAREIQNNIGKAKQFEASLQKAVGEVPKNLRQYRKALSLMSQGTPDTALVNAGIRGREQVLNGTPLGQFSQVVNQQARFMGQAQRAAENQLKMLARQNLAILEGNKAEQARVIIMARQERLAVELAKSGGQYTAEVEKANRQLQASQRLLETIEKNERAILKSKREQEQAAKRAAQEANRGSLREQRRQESHLEAVDPKNLAMLGDRVRTQRDEILFGDGGKSLLGLQARMLAQYEIINAVTGSFGFLASAVTELDRDLFKLQAITQSTDTEMQKLKGTILEIGKEGKVSLQEITNAAITMAQAGFSSREIDASLKDTINLAVATGSALEDSVDIVTSAIGVFNKRAEETGHISDVVTAALNLTKLSTDKLALGLQYAGNVAADAGVDFTELVAVLGQYSQAGIRSGSTLGTGVRQLIVDLQAPSEKLQERLKSLGLTQRDVDIKANGLVGTLKNLRAAGFTTADAMSSLEVRAAAAFSALTRNLDDVDTLHQDLLLSKDAAKAAEIQMDSFANKLDRFKSASTGAAYAVTEGLLTALGKVLDMGTSVVGTLQGMGKAGEVFGAALGTAALTGVAVFVLRTTGILGAATSAVRGIQAMTAANTAFTASSLAAARAFFLTPAGLASLGVFAAIALLTEGFGALSSSSDDFKTKQEELQVRIDRTKSEIDSLEQAISSVDTTTDNLVARSARLNSEQTELATVVTEARSRFGELGLQLDDNVTSVEELLEAFRKLRADLAKGIDVQFRLRADQLREQADSIVDQLRSEDRRSQAYELGERFGFRGPLLGSANRNMGLERMLSSRSDEPAIAAALKTLAEKQPAASSVDQALRGVLDRLSQADKASAPEEFIGSLKELRDSLRTLRGQLSQIEANNLRANQADQEADEAGFRGRVEEGVLKALQTATMQREQALSTRLVGVKNQGDRSRIADQIGRDSLDTLSTGLSEVAKGLDAGDQQRLFKVYADKIGSFRVETMEKVGAIMTEADELLKEEMAAKVRLYEDQIGLLRNKLNDSDKSDDGNVAKQLEALITERTKVAKELIDKNLGPSAPPDIRTTRLAIEDQKAKAEIDSIREQVDKAAGEMVERQLQSSLKAVEKQIATLEKKMDEGTPADRMAVIDQLRPLIGRATEIRRELLNFNPNLRFEDRETEGESLDEAAQQKIKDLSDKVRDYVRTLSKKEVEREIASVTRLIEVEENKANDGTEGDRSQATARMKQLLDKRVALQERLLDLDPTIDPDDRSSQIESYRQEAGQRVTEMRNKIGDFVRGQAERELNDQISLVTQEIQLLQRKATKDGGGDTPEDIDRLKALRAQLGELQKRKIREFESREASADVIARRLAMVDSEQELDIADFEARRAKPYKYEPFDGRGSDRERFADINREYDLAQDKLEIPRKTLETRRSAYDLPMNKRQISDAQRYQLDRTIDAAQTAEFQRSAENELARVKALRDEIAAVLKEREDLQNRFEQLDQRLAADGLDEKEGEKIENERNQVGQQMLKLDEQIARAQDMVAESTQKADAALEQYNARVKDMDTLSWGETLSASFEEWAEAAGIYDSGLKQLADSSKQVFSSAREGLKTFAMDVSTRTKGIGAAFKDMALNIANSMLEIVAGKAADQFLNLLFKGAQFAIGFLGPGGGTAAQGTGAATGTGSAATPTPTGYSNLVIRRSGGGPITGPVKNRDSVMVHAQPGEFMLRESAVKAIGVDTLHQLNAAGSKATLKGQTVVAPIMPNNPEGGGTVNVWVVADKGEAPPMGPRDVIAVWTDDFQRNGVTKKLVKQVKLGG